MKKQNIKQDIFKQVINLSDLKLERYRTNEQFWQFICLNFDLPDQFIREYKHIIDWGWVSRYQDLSNDFIREFKHKIDWEYFKHRLHGKQKKEFEYLFK